MVVQIQAAIIRQIIAAISTDSGTEKETRAADRIRERMPQAYGDEKKATAGSEPQMARRSVKSIATS